MNTFRYSFRSKLCLFSLMLAMSVSHVATAQALAQRFADNSGQHNNNVPLKTLLDDLSTKQGLRFNHNAVLIRDVYVNNDNTIKTGDNVEQKLNQILAGTNLRCKKIDNDTFVIRSNDTEVGSAKKNVLVAEQSNNAESLKELSASAAINESPMLVEKLSQPQQDATISGKVIDKESNVGLPRVTVRLKGSRVGSISDKEGNFKFPLSDPQGTLVFSSIGYRTVEVPIAGKSSISVSMEVDWKLFEDVVVTALGIKKESKKLGYSTAVVKGNEMTQARETNVANALVGKVSGVNVSAPASGAGGSSRVVIRGNTSISSDNQPLYVVNGIPIDNSNLGSAGQWGGFDAGDGISSLNPDDIESMNVLKGATAAALYGSRAKNGAIIIATKRGKGGEKGIGVEFNSNMVFESIRDYSDKQDQYGQGVRGNKPTSAASARVAGLSSWGAKLDGSSVVQFDGVSRPYSLQSTNLSDYYRGGLTWTNTVAVGGGSESTNYRLSASNLSNTGVYPNSDLNRKTFNAGTTFKLSPELSGEASVIYTTENATNRPGQSDSPGNGNFAIGILPTSMSASILKGPNGNGTDQYLHELTDFTDNPFVTNPYFAAYKFLNATQKNRIIASANVKYNLTDWLYLQGRVGQDYFTFQTNSITPAGTAYLSTGSFGSVNKTSQTTSEVNADALLGMDKELTNDISLAASVGASVRKSKTEAYGAAGNSLVFPDIYNPQYAITSVPSYRIFQKEVQSVYGSVELSFQEMLFLNATARNDWFSTVSKDNYAYLYPSLSGSFVFSEALKADWLSFGKIRVAYATVGGDTDPYATKLYYNINASKISGNPIGGFDNILPNTKLKPLSVSELEVGLELRLFDSRLTIDAAWYQKDTKNEIVTATVSATSGFQSAIINNGQLQNTGVELLISGKILEEKDFGWTSSFNFSVNNSKVVALAEGQTSLTVAQSRTQVAFIQHRVGEEFSQIVVNDFARDKNGAIVYDADGLPKQGDLVSMGSGVHPYTGGWENDFRYGNFSLGVLIDFKFGGKIYSATNAYLYQFGLHKETLPGRDAGITGVGVTEDGKANTKLVTPGLIQSYYGRIGGQIGTPFVYDASFIKLRQVSLGYDLPTSWLESTPVKKITLSLVARNLAILMKKTPNIDPETNINVSNAQGLELAGVPPTRAIGFNLNVKF